MHACIDLDRSGFLSIRCVLAIQTLIIVSFVVFMVFSSIVCLLMYNSRLYTARARVMTVRIAMWIDVADDARRPQCSRSRSRSRRTNFFNFAWCHGCMTIAAMAGARAPSVAIPHLLLLTQFCPGFWPAWASTNPNLQAVRTQ
jgi:hypothetical protein